MVQDAIKQIEQDVPSATAVKDGSAPAKVDDSVPHWEQPSQGLLDDIRTFRFMRIPGELRDVERRAVCPAHAVRIQPRRSG